MGPTLLSQLAHVELTTPRFEESLAFWHDIAGLELTERQGSTAYLRAWGDRFHHTLQLTEGEQTALGHVGWRAAGPDALEDAVARLEAAGVGEGWYEDAVGHGRAFRYRGPGGHVHEIFWDVERFSPPRAMASPFPNRPQRYVPRGAALRCIDHVTVVTSDPDRDARWYRDTLGQRYMEYTTTPDRRDFPVFAMSSVCERSHDLGLVWDPTGDRGRVNHLAYFVDSREELLRVADVLLNQDVAIEFGPGRHGMGEQDYLYVREPSGMRLEINAGGYRNYEPDWETVRYEPEQGSNVFYKNGALPPSMFESFPAVPMAAGDAKSAQEQTGLFV